MLVRLHAAGVNPVDTKLRANGTYYPGSAAGDPRLRRRRAWSSAVGDRGHTLPPGRPGVFLQRRDRRRAGQLRYRITPCTRTTRRACRRQPRLHCGRGRAAGADHRLGGAATTGRSLRPARPGADPRGRRRGRARGGAAGAPHAGARGRAPWAMPTRRRLCARSGPSA
ncbi:MAG: hypothetical protein MZW92_09530 [Comamonadaceae bacterium]|nr:hypothetical protein [Comamonadaceae bacterium]